MGRMSRWLIDRPVKGGRRVVEGGRTIVVDLRRVQSGGRGSIGCRCTSMSLQRFRGIEIITDSHMTRGAETERMREREREPERTFKFAILSAFAFSSRS